MPEPSVWLILPSASLALCRKNLPAWRERGYRIAVLQDKVRGKVPADVTLEVDRYEGWAASINTLARHVLTLGADICVASGDDILPDQSHTAAQIARQFLDHFKGTNGVMQPQGDTFNQAAHYCASPWLGAEWCRRMYEGRGPLCPDYFHNWADNELYWLALSMNRLWLRSDLTQEHEHFSRQGESTPEYWSQSALNHDRTDAELFIQRAAAGFPGHAPKDAQSTFDRNRFDREYRMLAEVHLATRHKIACAAFAPAGRLRSALNTCATRGFRRIALLGAGMHTRAALPLLGDVPVEIACIVDDNPALESARIESIPVCTVAQARAQKLDAVILSSNTQEDALARAAVPFERDGIPVIRLYTPARAAA